MLLTFPALLDFSLVGILLLRITAGGFFLLFGFRLIHATHLVSERGVGVRIIGYVYGMLKLVAGILLLTGVYTQVGAVLGATLSTITFLQSGTNHSSIAGKQVQLLLTIICLSLLLLGPGILAIDLPL